MKWARKRADSCVIDQNVQPAKSLFDRGGQLLHRCQVGHVALFSACLASGGENCSGGRLQGLWSAPAKNNRGAQGCQLLRDGGPDAAPSPGYKGNLL